MKNKVLIFKGTVLLKIKITLNNQMWKKLIYLSILGAIYLIINVMSR